MLVPARVASILIRQAGLAKFRVEHRGGDPELDAVLVALTLASYAYRGSVAGTEPRNRPEPVAASTMTTTQAAERIGVSDSAIRKAVRENHLAATKDSDGHWLIEPEDLDGYRAVRAA